MITQRIQRIMRRMQRIVQCTQRVVQLIHENGTYDANTAHIMQKGTTKKKACDTEDNTLYTEANINDTVRIQP